MTGRRTVTTEDTCDRSMPRPPLFLVGALRSGTTLLRLMLDHHPEIAFEREFEFAVEQVRDDGVFPNVDAYTEWLKTVRGFNFVVDRSLGYKALVDGFLRQKQLAGGLKPHVGATLHHHFHRLLHIWPDARFIHLIRDPRDVARSIVEKGWAGNPYVGARSWLESEQSWDLLADQLHDDQAIDIRYEQLVANPVEELTRICRFVGVEFHEAMLSYTETAIQYPQPDSKLANQWMRKSSPRQIEQVELQVSELMSRRGYALTVYPKIGRFRHAFLTLDSRVKCFGKRIMTYGIGLVMRDMIARRLGLRGLQRHVKQEINAVQAALIKMEADGRLAPSANITPVSDARTQSMSR